ncbi:uncharacterized protein DUF982 [Rhizobium sp. BK251]|nr:uncharacterized protein DUF982 [Rhizobium sp. BK251]
MTGSLTFTRLRVGLGGPGAYRTIHTVEEAADCLSKHWPTMEGRAFGAAQKIILEAMHGTRRPGAARRALIEAAHEADIAVIE